ncbi:Kinesin-like protein like protein, partial [Aduncisulcus paluster]
MRHTQPILDKPSENIHVIVRLRPLIRGEKTRSNIHITGDKVVVPSGPDSMRSAKEFSFAKVYPPSAKNEDVKDSIKPIIEAVKEGYNATMFAYGQTSSGKTHTIAGSSYANDHGGKANGLAPAFLEELFKYIKGGDVGETDINLSFVELYNDSFRDLIVSSKRPYLKFQNGKYVLKDARTVVISELKQAQHYFHVGLRKRETTSTEHNERSSRSHAILVVNIKHSRGDHSYHSIVNIVDLAGSERLTAASTWCREGKRQRETQSINSSLHVLRRVIRALINNPKGCIPYRENPLTKLLQDSIGGSARTLFVACISENKDHLAESISTLEYASQARLIRNNVRSNISLIDSEVNIVDLLQEKLLLGRQVEQLTQENKRLNQMLTRLIREREHRSERNEGDDLIESGATRLDSRDRHSSSSLPYRSISSARDGSVDRWDSNLDGDDHEAAMSDLGPSRAMSTPGSVSMDPKSVVMGSDSIGHRKRRSSVPVAGLLVGKSASVKIPRSEKSKRSQVKEPTKTEKWTDLHNLEHYSAHIENTSNVYYKLSAYLSSSKPQKPSDLDKLSVAVPTTIDMLKDKMWKLRMYVQGRERTYGRSCPHVAHLRAQMEDMCAKADKLVQCYAILQKTLIDKKSMLVLPSASLRTPGRTPRPGSRSSSRSHSRTMLSEPIPGSSSAKTPSRTLREELVSQDDMRMPDEQQRMPEEQQRREEEERRRREEEERKRRLIEESKQRERSRSSSRSHSRTMLSEPIPGSSSAKTPSRTLREELVSQDDMRMPDEQQRMPEEQQRREEEERRRREEEERKRRLIEESKQREREEEKKRREEQEQRALREQQRRAEQERRREEEERRRFEEEERRIEEEERRREEEEQRRAMEEKRRYSRPSEKPSEDSHPSSYNPFLSGSFNSSTTNSDMNPSNSLPVPTPTPMPSHSRRIRTDKNADLKSMLKYRGEQPTPISSTAGHPHSAPRPSSAMSQYTDRHAPSRFQQVSHPASVSSTLRMSALDSGAVEASRRRSDGSYPQQSRYAGGGYAKHRTSMPPSVRDGSYSSRLSLPSSSHVQGAVARSPRSRPGSDASPHHGSPTLPTRMLSSPSGPSNMSMKEKDSFQRMKRICDGVEHEWDRLLGELESFDVKE